MRIKVNREVEEDDVQIVYETPIDEDCQFIEEKVVNPPLGQTSNASGSRTTVITGRKRLADDPFTIPGENAACKRPALEADISEQPFLVQPTTSHHPDESTAQNYSLWQQPSISGEAEQLTLGRDEESSDSVASEVRTYSTLMPRGRKPNSIYTENGNQQCWSDPSTSGTQNEILNTLFNNAVIHNSHETQQDVISMTTQSNFDGIQENMNVVLANQQRVIKDYNDQQQADSTTTQSDIVSIPQTNNVNDNIPSTILTNQQQHSFGQNSQEDEQQTMITEPEHNIQANQESFNVAFIFDNNMNFQSLINLQEEEFELLNTQRTLQQAQSNISGIPENINVVLGNQQRVDEDYNHQQQADSPITISDIASIPQTNNTNDNSPSTTNQRLPVFEQYSQVAEQQTMSMIREPSIHGIEEIMSAASDNNHTEALVDQQQGIFEQDDSQDTQEVGLSMIIEPSIHGIEEIMNIASDNIHTEALVDQQQGIFEQDDSQDTQQVGLSMTTQPNTSQESIDIAGEINNSSDPLMNRIVALNEKVNKWIQNSSETGWQLKPRCSNALAVQESVDVAIQNLHEIISGTTDTIHPRASIKPAVPQGQVTGPFLKSNSVSTLGASGASSNSAVSSIQINGVSITPLTLGASGASSTSAVSSNQKNEVTITPLTVTQTSDLLRPTERRRLVINSSFFMKTEQHLVWKGFIECRKKRNGSQVTQPLNCRIYGLKTESGNINVNADLWPKQLVLLLLPSHLLLKQDLCKDLRTISRHAMIHFEQQGGMANVLQKSMIYGWMGFIQFPGPCDRDMMIVLYIPQKSVYIGFIANNVSGFITKFKQVCRDYHLELLQKQISLPSSSRQTQTPPQPFSHTLSAHHQANLIQSSSQPTSLSLPAHQQPTLPQVSYQQTSLPSTSQQQPGFPLSHHQTSMPQCTPCYCSITSPLPCWPYCSHQLTALSPTSHLQTSLTQSSYLETSLPQSSHLQTSLPQPTNLQTSLPQPTHLQTSLSQPTHIQINLPQPTHPQNSLPQPTHIQISLPQMQVQTSLPQSSHIQNSLPQSSHIQSNLPQSSHMQTGLPQSSHVQTPFPRVFPSLPNPAHPFANLMSRMSRKTSKLGNARRFSHRPNANKYDTADRTIDAYISAIRYRKHLSQGAGPSTSQQPLTSALNQQGMSQGSGASNSPLIQTSGATNSFPPACSPLLEAQASEIFPVGLVKEVTQQRLRAYNSLEELCDAVIEYEERKCKKESKETKSKGDETNEALLCKICMDEQMNMVFEPCGHLSTCLECSQSLYKCPMCRTIITNKRRIYMS